MSICYLNGTWLELAEARVSVLDRGFIFGDGVYEVIPAPAGRPFGLAEHLERLARSLHATSIAAPMSAAAWAELILELIRRNGGGDVAIYLQVTRGVAERDHAFPPGVAPTVFAMCKPLPVAQGLVCVSAITLPDNRWARCDIKSTSLLANVLLRNVAVRRGCYEALLVRDGCLTEGAASNVFVVHGGRVRTPPLGPTLLAGVTRGLLIDALHAAGGAVEECAVGADELVEADEIWVTSSSRDLLCVSVLDGKKVGDGEHYPRAAAALDALAARRARALSAP
ncbi:MAG: aminotransferase class IV [Gammaproteobacteria bacterium]